LYRAGRESARGQVQHQFRRLQEECVELQEQLEQVQLEQVELVEEEIDARLLARS
jgi:hypothetical protein